jgi:7-cyano-7-deazaguanine synthase
MAKDLAIVLNNGSINSAVTTALAAQRYRPVLIHAELSTMVGPRLRAAYDQQVGHFRPYREHTLPMPFLADIQASAQAGGASNNARFSVGLATQLQDALPLVAMAARFAVHYQAAAIYMGLRVGGQGDELAQASEYVQIWNELIQLPCGHADLEVVTPLLELEPWQVIDVGYQVSVPFDRTWSCTEESNEPCWACRACRSREAAFQQAAKPDPLRTAKKG